MRAEEGRNRDSRTRVEEWQARFEQPKTEGREVAGEARREHVERLQDLRAAIAEQVREWSASIDDFESIELGAQVSTPRTVWQ